MQTYSGAGSITRIPAISINGLASLSNPMLPKEAHSGRPGEMAEEDCTRSACGSDAIPGGEKQSREILESL